MTRLSSWKAADVAARLSKSGKGKSKKAGNGWKACCPAHDDGTPSLSLSNSPDGKLLYHCFGGCEASDVKRALLAVLGGEEIPEYSDADREKEKVESPWEVVFPVPEGAAAVIEDFQHGTYGAPSRVWTYRLPEGRIGGWIARYDIGDGKKEIIPYTWQRNRNTAEERVKAKSMPDPRPLYNLDQIVERPDAIILLAEGEKSADAAVDFFPDWVPTAIPGGSNAVRLADLTPFAGRTVVIMADHDGPGYEFALKVIQAAPNSCDIRMVVWPKAWPASKGGAPYVMEKGDDAYDHRAAGWDKELLKEALKETGKPLTHRIGYLPEAPFEAIQYTENRPS